MSRNLPTLRINRHVQLPDSGQWQFRFEVRSESSNRVYVISQHKNGKYWGCSCPGWITHRRCKHLDAIGLPGNQKPYEPNIITD